MMRLFSGKRVCVRKRVREQTRLVCVCVRVCAQDVTECACECEFASKGECLQFASKGVPEVDRESVLDWTVCCTVLHCVALC